MRVLTRPTVKPAKGAQFMGLNGNKENYTLNGSSEMSWGSRPQWEKYGTTSCQLKLDVRRRY